jgi:hypothetical protein
MCICLKIPKTRDIVPLNDRSFLVNQSFLASLCRRTSQLLAAARDPPFDEERVGTELAVNDYDLIYQCVEDGLFLVAVS